MALDLICRKVTQSPAKGFQGLSPQNPSRGTCRVEHLEFPSALRVCPHKPFINSSDHGGCMKARPISQASMNICTLESFAFRKG